MFGKRIKLFTIFGFTISIDLSWFFLAVVVAWSLASSVFPAWHTGLSGLVYLWMGVAGAIGLFASIVLHELSHSVIARHHGIVMSGITLFIFGGVAEMTEEPPSAKAEFQVAIAGPIASILVAASCALVGSVGGALAWPDAVIGVLRYLSEINLVLVIFNMIPAFPLDGGRVLRALLWRRNQNLIDATRITSRIGVGFSFVLIGLGVLSAISGNLVGGIWFFLIGMFLRNAATMSYRQLLVRQSLAGETVGRFMKPDPVTAPPDVTISALVEDYVYRYHFKLFPVVDGERLIGCVTTRQIRNIAREDWPSTKVSDIMAPCGPDNSIRSGANAVDAIATMSRLRVSRLMVVDGDRLCGIVTLKDLLEFLALKSDLEGR